MANTSRRKRHHILGVAAALAVTVLVAVVVAALVVWMRQPEKPPPVATAPGSSAPSAVPTSPSKPRPEFQDASCPDVQVISVPGTWESSPQLDPLNPTQFPIALLLNVTNPVRG